MKRFMIPRTAHCCDGKCTMPPSAERPGAFSLLYFEHMFLLKLIWNLLAVLGLLTLVGIGFLVWLWFSNPFLQNIFKPTMIWSEQEVPDETDSNPALSAEQETALRSSGVDPASLPSEITPEMEVCFEEKLGAERYAEIKAGSEPTVTDFFKAQSCLS